METDWVLVLDADEELDSEAKTQFPDLLRPWNVGGYLVPIRNYIPTVTGRGWDRVAEPNRSNRPRARQAPAYFVHENCRLFRRDPEIYFVGRVHELVEPRIQALGRRLSMAPICIHHFGQLAREESRNRKATAYCDLLRLKVQDLPDDAMAWTQLGLQEYECSREPEEALRCFDRALALEPKAPAASLFKGMVYLDCGHQRSSQRIRRGAARRPKSRSTPAPARRRAPQSGSPPRRSAAYSEAVRLSGNDPVLSSKLGYTDVRLGRTREGITRLKQAAERAPEVAEIRERLMKALVALNSLAEAADQAEKLAGSKALRRLIYAPRASECMPGKPQRRGKFSIEELRSFQSPRNSAGRRMNSAKRLKRRRCSQ